jgi:HEAT repeat protein
LVDVLASPDGALRGDTADLLGQIGDGRAVEALEALRSDPNPDVAEVAADAIEQIRQAGRSGERPKDP